MAQTEHYYLDAEGVRHALATLLKRWGVEFAEKDVIVATTQTRRGHPIHIVIALNGAGEPLARLIEGIAVRRNATVGAPGIFLLRPDDVRQLVSTIRA